MLDVPSGAEEAFRGVERDGVHATGQGLAACRQCQVVGTRQARDGVEQDHHVAAGLDLPLGDLERHLRDASVVLGRLVKGRGVDLALYRAAHVRHFLGTLADERHHQERVGVVLGYAVRDVLEDGGLAGLGRGQDQPALPLADRRNQVDEPLGEVLLIGLEVEHVVREDRDQGVEVWPPLGGLRVDAVDRVDAEQAPILLLVLGRSRLAGHLVARAQSEASDLRGADIDVVRRRHDAVAAQEPEALVDDLQDPFGDAGLPVLLDARAGRRQWDGVKELQHQILVFHLLGTLDAVLRRQLPKLVDRLRLQLRERQGLHGARLIGRERAGVDARVPAGRVIRAATRVGGPGGDTARAAVGAAPGSVAARRAPFLVHRRLVCQHWFMKETDLKGRNLGGGVCVARLVGGPPPLVDASDGRSGIWNVGLAVRGSRADDARRSNGQILRVPALVVMLGPPYPLISPMSCVRILRRTGRQSRESYPRCASTCSAFHAIPSRPGFGVMPFARSLSVSQPV